MDNKTQELGKLVKQLNLTVFDLKEEEWILTPEEERNALEQAKNSVREHFRWKLDGLGYGSSEIEVKIAGINWIEKIDEKEVLSRANSNKHAKIFHDQQRELEKTALVSHQKQLKESWTATRIYRLMQATSEQVYERKFIVNEYNKELIKTVCFFLSRDERFESELKYDLNKGLLIRGISGLGKTYVVKCAQDNMLNPVLILSMLEISDEIRQVGEYNINMDGRKILYLDDVGTEEPTITHYGTRINFFKNFIEQYYHKNTIFNRLIVSTNNSAQELENRYGFRVRSRMKDMFNVVDVQGEDMRG